MMTKDLITQISQTAAHPELIQSPFSDKEWDRRNLNPLGIEQMRNMREL
jgi:hypothetical protein